jgi:hypothetical protein
MINKTILAAAAIAATATIATATAEAKTKFDVYVDIGGGYEDSYRPRHQVADYGHDDYAPRKRRHHVEGDYGYGVSCGEGAQSVRYAGFRKVYAFDCNGRTYGYSAKRYGERYEVIVSAKSGRIISARPSY